MLDPSSALLLFALFQATEKVIGYAGGKIADTRARLERDAPNPDVSRRVCGALETLTLKPDAGCEWLAHFAPELEKPGWCRGGLT